MGKTFKNQLAEFMPPLRAFATMLCRNRDQAEDLAQDTLTRALSKADQFQHGTNLKAWLFTIMRNLHIDSVRQRRREAIIDVDDELLNNIQVSPAGQESRVVLQELLHSMARLTRDQREVLTLVVGHGMAYEDAAAVCNCPVGTIRSRLARARRELERMMLGENRPEMAHPLAFARERRAALN